MEKESEILAVIGADLSDNDRVAFSLLVAEFRLSVKDRRILLTKWKETGTTDSFVEFCTINKLLRPQAALTLSLVAQGVLQLAAAKHVLQPRGSGIVRGWLRGVNPQTDSGVRLAVHRDRNSPEAYSDTEQRPIEIEEPLGSGSRLGRCRLLREIARGSSCRVFEAMHESLQIPVAVKVFHGGIERSEAFRGLFVGEARQLARLAHPNIIRVLDFEDGVVPYIVMEYAGGLSLSNVISSQRALSIDHSLSLLEQVAAALHYAHDAGIVHRDVKPANILFAESGVAKIADLGIARFSTTVADTRSLDGSGLLCGTPRYIAPEQAFQPNSVDGRADCYALGATVFHALAGQPPFDGGDSQELIMKHVSWPPPRIGDFRPKAPASLESLIQAMMAKDPGDRPDNLGVVATEARRIRAHGLDDTTVPLRGTKTVSMMLREKVQAVMKNKKSTK